MKQKTKANYIYLIVLALVLVAAISSCAGSRGGHCPSVRGMSGYK